MLDTHRSQAQRQNEEWLFSLTPTEAAQVLSFVWGMLSNTHHTRTAAFRALASARLRLEAKFQPPTTTPTPPIIPTPQHPA